MQVLFMEVLFPFTIFAVLMVLLRGFSYSVNTSVGKSWLATLAREKYEQNVCIAACFHVNFLQSNSLPWRRQQLST